MVAMHWGWIAGGKRWVGVVEGRVPSRPARPQATSLLLRGTLQQRCTLATPLAGMEPGPPSATPRGCYALGYSRRQALGGSFGRSSSISTSAHRPHPSCCEAQNNSGVPGAAAGRDGTRPSIGLIRWVLTAGVRHWRCSQCRAGVVEGRVPSRPARPQTTSLLLRGTLQQRCTCWHRWPGWNPALHRAQQSGC